MSSNQSELLDDEFFESDGLEQDSDKEFFDDSMEPFNPADIDIVTESQSLDRLIERIEHSEIDMNTDFQRHGDLWNNHKMSRLIESILIRFPLPAFYFDASDDDQWLIVDGLQRLSSIKKFVIDKKLHLSGLEFLTDLNGKSYDELHRSYQRRIKECAITVYKIKPGTPADVKYSVFRRINTGGMTLNNQEIRNAMVSAKDRNILKELAHNSLMNEMMGDLSKRMIDQELVLRFWAFYSFDYFDKNHKKAIAPFLDMAMAQITNATPEQHQELREAFTTAINRCHELLQEKAFVKDLEKPTKRKNSALFEVWMVSLARLTYQEFELLLVRKKELITGIGTLLENEDFYGAITYSTQKEGHVRIRYDKVNQLIRGVLNA
jgi:cell division protein ZapA (FtsZ GTPase activity inhibitor)